VLYDEETEEYHVCGSTKMVLLNPETYSVMGLLLNLQFVLEY
jgi:hypothetical protein